MNDLLEMKEMKSTMSSVEIAKLTGKRHDNVLRKCRELIEKGIILATQSEERDTRGKFYPVFNLNKVESLNIVANLSPEFTAIIIDRWQELENPRPLTRIELLERMLDVERANEQLRLEVIEAEAKAIRRLSKIGDHLAGSVISEIENNVTFNNVAKILSSNLCIKLGHNNLMALCRDNGWLMTGDRSKSEKNMPFQNKMDYFKIKLFHNPDTNVVSITPVLTPKGVVKLSKLVPIWFTE